jgi:hypothetical protein
LAEVNLDIEAEHSIAISKSKSHSVHISVDDEHDEDDKDDEYVEDDEVDEEHGDEPSNVTIETPTTEFVEEFGEPHTHVDDDEDENEVEDPSLKAKEVCISEGEHIQMYGSEILFDTRNQVEVVAEGEPVVLTIDEQETKKEEGFIIEEETKDDAENVEEKGLQIEKTNFDHGLQLIEEWIAKPNHVEDCKEDTTTWNNTKGHQGMP